MYNTSMIHNSSSTAIRKHFTMTSETNEKALRGDANTARWL